jgi:hypothetical protein
VVFGVVSDRALRGHGDGADVSVGLRLLEWWAEVVFTFQGRICTTFICEHYQSQDLWPQREVLPVNDPSSMVASIQLTRETLVWFPSPSDFHFRKRKYIDRSRS